MPDDSRPNKFGNLQQLQQLLNIPKCILLDDNALSGLFANFDEIVLSAGAILDRIGRTAGAFLQKDLAEIQSLVDDLKLSDDSFDVLLKLMSEEFGDKFCMSTYAVRSASRLEDTASNSFAGLFDSYLHVGSVGDILDAIRRVWLSAYSRAAVTERIHTSNFSPVNPMNVMIQTMVVATKSGVAFSKHPVTHRDIAVVELVSGVGDVLVSGEQSGEQFTFDPGMGTPNEDVADEETGLVLGAVMSLLRQVESELEHPTDIEWAWDGTTAWLLQARPITGLGQSIDSTSLYLRVADLYGASAEDLQQIGVLPDFAVYFREKRKRIVDFARRHDLNSGRALVIAMNAQGLVSDEFSQKVLGEITCDEVVLDFSDSLRQIILPRNELAKELELLMTHPSRVYTMVLREFVRGDVGIISHLSNAEDSSDTVLGEWSDEGLLAINRGTARTNVIQLSHSEDVCAGLTSSISKKLYLATVAAAEEIGGVQIEWVLVGEKLYPLDFSFLSQESSYSNVGDKSIVSRGYASAPIFHLADSADLSLLSIAPSVSLTEIPSPDQLGPVFTKILAAVQEFDERPIIVTARPLAALASLLPYVAGFIFEHAAVLSHLSILIRERGLPAVQNADVYEAALTEKRTIVDINDDVNVIFPKEAGNTKG